MSIKFTSSAKFATAESDTGPFSVVAPLVTPGCLPLAEVKLFAGSCMCRSLSSMERCPALTVLFSLLRGKSSVT